MGTSHTPERLRPLVVAAIGGNALLRRGEPMSIATQRANVAVAAAALAEVAATCDLAIVHGNGPQVGLLALESAAGPDPMPLDVLDAESQGQIGYLLEIELGNALPADRSTAVLLTQVEVDVHDPAFGRPTKPIGPVYDHGDAERLSEAMGWVMVPDGPGLRRVVPSPEPRTIVDMPAIELLLDDHIIVICGGGGGIPVAVHEGRRHGVEAVVDKDLTASLLAIQLDAAQLLLLTDVDGVYPSWPSDHASPIARCSPGLLRSMDLAAGSMGPKAEAACRFVEATGRPAVIAALDDAVAALAGASGTLVTVEPSP